MPELPEVETVARDLRGLVVGARISGVRVSWLKTLRSQDPEAFERAVVGREIVGTSRRAKLVVLELDDARAITIHLKMTGQLFVVRAGQLEDPYVRLVLVFEDGRELWFRDIRKFGRVGIAGRGASGDLEGELGGPKGFKGFGPEPLDPAFTARVFRRRIRGRKGRLKPLLLDQAFLAGVGNIYADEALWAARLHPLRSAASLRVGDAARLYRAIRAILAEAVERRGSSIDDYTAPDGDGEMQERLLVYQRAGEPCKRCGRPVRRIVIGARSTHFCSWCQRLPKVEQRAAAAILRGMEPKVGRPRGTSRRRTDDEATRPGGSGDPARPALDGDRRRGRIARDADRLDAPGCGRCPRLTRRADATRRCDETSCGQGLGRRPQQLMSILRFEAVHREIGAFVILDRIDAAIALGDRVGLVGPNGAGKTTLLRIAAGIDEPDAGKVARKRDLSIGMLAQEAHLDAAFMAAPDVRTAIRHGAAGLEAMAAELEAMEHAGHAAEPAYESLQHRFEGLGGYTLDQRVDEALSGLGFAPADMGRAPASLSGGEQTRATLARLVIASPDLLLLDEPTNHLDLGALEWLEDHLRRRAGSLLVASHDRAFLDGSVNRIWELRDRKLTAFRGDYSSYHRQREERDAFAAKSADTHEQQIARERELVQTYRSHRKITKMHEHESRLERLMAERQDAPRAQRKLRLPGGGLVGAGPVRSGEIVVRAEALVVGYLPDKRVATAPFLAARRGDRIGIVGPNGAGKTTLLRTIAGELPPLDGSIAFGNGVQLGYLAQLRAAAIPGTTVLDALLETVPVTAGEARSYLARFLFRGDDTFKEVRLLSGGERSRLELALLGVMPSNVHLLDEPTNHLDVVAREAIETFLLESPATLLVVSHDRRFLESICERLWVVDDGSVAPFDGGYRAWRAAVADGWTVASALEQEARRLRPVGARREPTLVGAGRETAVATVPAQPDRARRPARGNGARLSKDAYRRQRDLADAELTRLGLRKNHLELELSTPAVQANFIELRRVSSELADVDQALAAAEDAWLALEERAP